MKVTVELSEQEIAAAIDRAVEVNQSVRATVRRDNLRYDYVWSFTDEETRYLVTSVDGVPVACTCPHFAYGVNRTHNLGVVTAAGTRVCKHMRKVMQEGE